MNLKIRSSRFLTQIDVSRSTFTESLKRTLCDYYALVSDDKTSLWYNNNNTLEHGRRQRCCCTSDFFCWALPPECNKCKWTGRRALCFLLVGHFALSGLRISLSSLNFWGILLVDRPRKQASATIPIYVFYHGRDDGSVLTPTNNQQQLPLHTIV